MNTEPPTGDDLQRLLVTMKTDVIGRVAAEPRRNPSRRHWTLILAFLALLSIGGVSGAVALGLVPQPFAAAPPTSPSPTTTSEGSTAPLSQTPTPSAVPSTTPSELPAVQDPADPSTWLITFDGIGPLTVGGSLVEEKPSMLVRYSDTTDDTCPVAGFSLEGFADVIAQIDTDLDTIHSVSAISYIPEPLKAPVTEAGIGVGSTVEELLTAYPNITETGQFFPTTGYGLSDGAGRWIAFSVMDDLVTVITVGPSDRTPYEFCG
jgi:hypothetical protein